MSGSLIGGVVGAAIGYFVPVIGPALGYAIGSIAGGMLFPEQVQGPRLQDLRAQSSEYGRPIPIVYGTIALGGNVIWASDLVEVESESGGGKGGGPEVTNYSYFANFAVAICEGEVSLGRIWAGPEKRLIWDGATLEGAEAGAQLRFYSGSETQEPDPLMESYLGAGMVPAYRGTAYLVLENFPVAKDGNRIPFLTVEVGRAEANVAPVSLEQTWIQQVFFWGGYYAVLYYGLYNGIVIRHADDNTLFGHYTYDVPNDNWINSDECFLDSTRGVLVQYIRETMQFRTYAIADGAQTTYTITVPVGADADPASDIRGACLHNGYWIFGAGNVSGGRITLYVVDPTTKECIHAYSGTAPSGQAFFGPLRAPNDSSAVLYGLTKSPGIGTAGALYEIPISSNFTPVSLGEPAYIHPNSTLRIGCCRVDPNTGYIWTLSGGSIGDGYLDVCVNDPATRARIFYQRITTTLVIDESVRNPFLFLSGSPNTAIIAGYRYGVPTIDQFLTFNADTPALTADLLGASALYIGALGRNPITGDLMAFRRSGWISFGDTSDPTTANTFVAGTATMEPDNKYIGEADGTVQPQGQPLSEIVLDLSQRAGLDASQVDVSQLADDTVDGYAIANQMDVRAAINAMAPAYFFDGVESGAQVKYVKRGGAIAATVADDELGAYESGGQAPDPLETSRKMDDELPANFNVRYIRAATKYDAAARLAKRLIGNSGTEATLDLPIVMTDTKAQEVAEVNLHGPWVARLTYRFSLPRKYAYLEPTDVIVVGGYTMRIVSIKQTGGRYQCEAVHDDSNVYVPHVIVTETLPPPPDFGGVETVSETLLELM